MTLGSAMVPAPERSLCDSGGHRAFFRALRRRPGNVGAVFPSSARLAAAMVADLDLDTSGAILELGPGTGPMTSAIDAQLHDKTRYLGIELDDDLVGHLRQRFPHLAIAHGSAEEASALLSIAGHDGVRAIISGLPFASLPAAVQDGIVDELDRLMGPGVVFRTFQYVHSWPLPQAARFRRRMSSQFGVPHVSRPVLRNLPPALVLTYRRPAA